MRDKIRTKIDAERDNIKIKQLDLNVMIARLGLQEAEMEYNNFLGSLEARKIMEDDQYNIYNVQPSDLPPDLEVASITPPPSDINELYTTISQKFSSVTDDTPGKNTTPNFGSWLPSDIKRTNI